LGCLHGDEKGLVVPVVAQDVRGIGRGLAFALQQSPAVSLETMLVELA
jgi:hypothetical protein